MSTYNLCFEQKYENYPNFYLKIFIFLVAKFPVYLNRHVFVMLIHNYHHFAAMDVSKCRDGRDYFNNSGLKGVCL